MLVHVFGNLIIQYHKGVEFLDASTRIWCNTPCNLVAVPHQILLYLDADEVHVRLITTACPKKPKHSFLHCDCQAAAATSKDRFMTL